MTFFFIDIVFGHTIDTDYAYSIQKAVYYVRDTRIVQDRESFIKVLAI